MKKKIDPLVPAKPTSKKQAWTNKERIEATIDILAHALLTASLREKEYRIQTALRVLMATPEFLNLNAERIRLDRMSG